MAASDPLREVRITFADDRAYLRVAAREAIAVPDSGAAQ